MFFWGGRAEFGLRFFVCLFVLVFRGQKMQSVTLKHVLSLTWLDHIMYLEKLENLEYLLLTLSIEIFCYLDFKKYKFKFYLVNSLQLFELLKTVQT